jgi:intracellular septation protein
MKLSLSIFWRIIVLQLLAGLVLALSLQGTALMSDLRYIPWKTTIGFMVLAFAVLATQFLIKVSLIRVVFGARLGLADKFWKSLSFALGLFYLLLAVANVAVSQIASFDVWNVYKLVAPLLALLVFSAIMPRHLKTTPV